MAENLKPAFKLIYGLMIALLFLEVFQSVLKLFNPYYFNAFRLGVFALLLFGFGLHLKVSKIFAISVFTIVEILVLLMFFVVWN